MKLSLIFSMIFVFMFGVSTNAGHHSDSMVMHHMHIMLNHAAEMAAEGSNLLMVGQMNMAPGVDSLSIEHGTMMLNKASELVHQVLEGEAMQNLHRRGITPDKNEEMAYTHLLAHKVLNLIEVLKAMPSAMSQ